MDMYDRITPFSSLPIVNLNDVRLPSSGLNIPLSKACQKNFSKSSLCRSHYNSLSKRHLEEGTLVQCPFGFASIVFLAGNVKAAVTGFVATPRLGGKEEAFVAKHYKENRVYTESAIRAILRLREVARRFQGLEQAAVERLESVEVEATRRLHALEDEIAQKHSMALHEIRKMNRTVVQEAERLCSEHSPGNPAQADQRMVNIWKTAELMSKQFDIVEILANETLTRLPVKTPSQVYKIFDKCVRAYQAVRGSRRLFLQAPPSFSPKTLVCEKTFPIIPTVLISNALKYSASNTEVRVMLEPEGRDCVASVISEALGDQVLDEKIFLRGVRASRDNDGSGNGLYVAQLVAKQHGTKIVVDSFATEHNSIRHIFKVRLRGIGKS